LLYFRRSDVVDLRTSISWREMGFDVIPGARKIKNIRAVHFITLTIVLAGIEPYKRVQRRQRTKRGTGRRVSAQVAENDLWNDEVDGAARDDDDLPSSAEGAGHNAEIGLYGPWQVQHHVAEPLVNGQVPVNEHGNFELWSSRHLPPNAAHVVVEGSKETAVAALLQVFVMCAEVWGVRCEV
jgi:hypothetical protein